MVSRSRCVILISGIRLQVLVNIGYLMLAPTLIQLTTFNESRENGGVPPNKKKQITRLLDFAILIAMYVCRICLNLLLLKPLYSVFGIIAGNKASSALTDPSAAAKVKRYRFGPPSSTMMRRLKSHDACTGRFPWLSCSPSSSCSWRTMLFCLPAPTCPGGLPCGSASALSFS